LIPTAGRDRKPAAYEVLPNSGEFTMRTSLPVACAAVLICAVFSGCSASGKSPSASTEDASYAADQGDGIHEYRAVCTKKELHAGNEYVLTTWLETRQMAKQIGDYHGELKYKGHIVRIEERVKPKRVVPPQ
jgi:hypothetical protein